MMESPDRAATWETRSDSVRVSKVEREQNRSGVDNWVAGNGEGEDREIGSCTRCKKWAPIVVSSILQGGDYCEACSRDQH